MRSLLDRLYRTKLGLIAVADGWISPRSEVAFVWVLNDEIAVSPEYAPSPRKAPAAKG